MAILWGIIFQVYFQGGLDFFATWHLPDVFWIRKDSCPEMRSNISQKYIQKADRPVFPSRHVFLRLKVFILLLLTASCTPFAPAKRSPSEMDMPSAYSINAAVSAPYQRWWEGFGDEQLNEFVEESLTGNLSLQANWARLKQAHARVIIAGADLYPSFTGEADSSFSRLRTTDGGTQTTGVENYSFGLFASYELDVWGRVRALRESSRLTEAASREDLNAAAITLAAEVTERWVRIISQHWRKRLLAQQLDTNLTYLELVELRFRKSLASALDVFQQRQVVERVKAQVPLVEQQELLQLQELAVLLGRMPQAAPIVERTVLPEIEAPPAAGIPSELLEARPDIQAAFHRLEAADQELAAARADRLPAFRLTGRANFDHDKLDRLLDNWLLNLAGSLTAPLVDGGRRRAEVLRNQAVVAEQLALYKQTVLTAVREVEAALTLEITLRGHIERLAKQLKAAQNALDQARTRYINGLNDYLPVLTQLLTVQDLEQDMIERQAELLIARVSLHRALGGTWTGDLVPPIAEDTTMKEYSHAN